MSSYDEFKKELLKNPEVKAEYDALEPEFNIIQAMLDDKSVGNAIKIRTCTPSKKG